MSTLKYFGLALSLMLFLAANPASSANAQTTELERVLIRNVVLLDPNGTVEDKIVNVLLRDNKLDVVTEDKISRDEADMVECQ